MEEIEETIILTGSDLSIIPGAVPSIDPIAPKPTPVPIPNPVSDYTPLPRALMPSLPAVPIQDPIVLPQT